MLFRRLKLRGLLSFGPKGVDLPMEPLTVAIGPNGSGKSNLLDAISLFQAAPRGMGEPVQRSGGMREWLWKGPGAEGAATLDATVDAPPIGSLRHGLTVTDAGGRLNVVSECIEPLDTQNDKRAALSYHRPPADPDIAREVADANAAADAEDAARKPAAGEWSAPRIVARYSGAAIHFAADFSPEDSLLRRMAASDHPALMHLSSRYERIRLYRDWSFGPGSSLRQPGSAHAPADFLDENAQNLPLVLSQLSGERKRRFADALRELFDGIVGVQCPVAGGVVSLFLEEADGRSIPATRLSDGTLRYLCLLAVLLHPKPPPLICMEEPELGLHPDLLPTLADLAVDASQRCQIVVTTHSDIFVDALTDRPESVVVCEKHDGATEMRRLDPKDMKKWLEDYRLGALWTSGELGGNRW